MRLCYQRSQRQSVDKVTPLKMKLVNNPNCLFCSEETPNTPLHRLYRYQNSEANWDMVNKYSADYRD